MAVQNARGTRAFPTTTLTFTWVVVGLPFRCVGVLTPHGREWCVQKRARRSRIFNPAAPFHPVISLYFPVRCLPIQAWKLMSRETEVEDLQQSCSVVGTRAGRAFQWAPLTALDASPAH